MTGDPSQALDSVTLPAALVPITEPTDETPTDYVIAPRLAETAARIRYRIGGDDGRRLHAGQHAHAARRWGERGAAYAGDLSIVAAGNEEAGHWLAAILHLVSL